MEGNDKNKKKRDKGQDSPNPHRQRPQENAAANNEVGARRVAVCAIFLHGTYTKMQIGAETYVKFDPEHVPYE